MTGRTPEYHADQLRKSADRAAILTRYADPDRSTTRSDLLRHTCHVCGWAACLPEEDVVRVVGDVALSPATLLSQLLARRGPGPVSFRLKESLERVRQRVCAVLARCDVSEEALLQWRDLQKRLPAAGRKRSMSEVPEGGGASQGQKYRGVTFKMVREEQRSTLVRADALSQAGHHAAVEAAIGNGHNALQQEDAEAMVRAVVEVVSLLARPRQAKSEATGCEMSEKSRQELRVANQTRLRTMLLKLLGRRGTGGLDLEDESTQRLLRIPFERLRSLTQDITLGNVMSYEQWIALADVVSPEHRRLTGSRTKGAERGMARGGSYVPPSVLRQNLSVNTGVREFLACSGCQQQITAEWYWELAKDDLRLIIPNSGHFPTKLRKCGNYLPLSPSVKYVRDHDLKRRLSKNTVLDT